MKITLLCAFICLAAALPNARQVQNLNSPHRVPGEFLIVLHKPVGVKNVQYAGSVAAKIAAISSKITVLKSFTNLVSPILYVKTSDESVMSQLFQLDEVAIIESEMHQNMVEQCSSQDSGSRLWGLSRVSVRDQPDYEGAQFSFGSNDGSGVRVYILDTSIRLTHEDFGGRAEFGENFVGGGNEDLNGHGTHCAGTAAGTEFGVAKAATLVAVKVLGDSGSGSFAGIIDGINWVVGDLASLGVRGVISMSLGGGVNLALNSAVDSADAAGVPVVVSAGNSNNSACNQSPASADEAITVGATDISDTLSSFSSHGPCMNIMGPGSSILSASHLSDTGSRTLSGTSMSCPHVAGWVAVYLADNPSASPAQVKQHIADTSTKDAIDLRGVSDTVNYMMYSSCA